MFRLCFVLCSVFLLLTTFAFPQGKGTEFRYEGAIEDRFSFAKEQPWNYSERVTLIVAVVGDLGRTKGEAIQIRLTETQQGRPVRAADVQIGKVSSDGKFLPTPRFRNLPMLFVSPKQIGVGKVWRAEEVLDERFFGQVLKGRVSYFVAGRSNLGGQTCYVVIRHLNEPAKVVHEGSGDTYIVTQWTDWFWVDAQTGLVHRWKRRSKYVAQDDPSQTVVTTTIDMTLKQVETLNPEKLERLRKDLQVLRLVQTMLDDLRWNLQVTVEHFERVEKELARAKSAVQGSPYADIFSLYLENWLSDLKDWRRVEEAKKLVGKPAPDFELPIADGKGKIKLSDLKGKVVLLNFFAYWCGPCNEAAPRLERIWREYKDKGVVVVGVAIWSSDGAFEEAQKFIQKHGLTFPIVVDPERKSKIAAEYRVIGVPTNVVVGKDGVVRYHQTGFLEKMLRQAFEEVLKK